MASHTRSGRLSQPALRWADEMVDRQAADRSQGRRRGGGDDHGRGPAGEQLLIEGGAEVLDLEEDEQEPGIEEEVVNNEVERQDDNDFGNLTERLEAPLPGPRVTQPEDESPDGWHLIDMLGVEDCFHCSFSTMQDVPGEFQMTWTHAWATVLRREVEAESDLAKERALKWMAFLSQGLEDTLKGSKGRQRCGFKTFSCSEPGRVEHPGDHVAVRCGKSKRKRAETSWKEADKAGGEDGGGREAEEGGVEVD